MTLTSGRALVKMALPPCRCLSQMAGLSPSRVRLSDNLSLLTMSDAAARGVPAQNVLRHTSDRPLAVLLPWLRATPKGVSKYADFYLSQGFNVLVNTVTARQLLLPETGSQEVARQLVDFLLSNEDVGQYVVHGFSIGAYYWGEVLGQMTWMDPGRSISKKIIGTVFDSPADLEEIPVGLPLAVTDNVILQRLIASYARLHLRLLEEKATRHYRAARQHFRDYPIESPVMFLWAKNDPVTSCDSIHEMLTSYEKQGRKVFAQCWTDSKHVRHLIQHPIEYHGRVAAFLEYLGHLRYPEKFPVHQRSAARSH